MACSAGVLRETLGWSLRPQGSQIVHGLVETTSEPPVIVGDGVSLQ